jgi:hypothetical protein
VRSWQEIGGLCSHTSQLEKPLIFLGLIGFNAKLGHWLDMPLVCDFCPSRSGTQAAPINAGQGGLVLSVLKEKTPFVLEGWLAGARRLDKSRKQVAKAKVHTKNLTQPSTAKPLATAARITSSKLSS